MNRRLPTGLTLLLALLAGGFVLTHTEAAAPPAGKGEDPVPPPPKMTTLSPRPKALSRSTLAGVTFLAKQQQADGGWSGGEMFGFFGGVGGPGAGLPARPGVPPARAMTPPSDVAN